MILLLLKLLKSLMSENTIKIIPVKLMQDIETIFRYIFRYKCNEKITLITLNLYKRNDCININILNDLIINDQILKAKEKWMSFLSDLYALNYDLNDNIIYRYRGLPQGSVLSPFLCNCFISKILKDPYYVNQIDQLRITVFADNIFIVCKDKTDLEIQNTIPMMENLFARYDLTFNLPKIIKFEEVWVPKNMTIPDALNIKRFKLLGLPILAFKNAIMIDPNRLQFNFIEPIAEPGYRVCKGLRKYVLPKYNFYKIMIQLE